MYVGHHVKHPPFFQTLIKLEFFGQIFEKYSSIKFHENPSSESGVVHADGQTDMTKGAALLWAITQRVLVIPYRRFGTTYLCHLRGSRIQERNSKSRTDMTKLIAVFSQFANALKKENPFLLPVAAVGVVIW
jgi:hypothetical protein